MFYFTFYLACMLGPHKLASRFQIDIAIVCVMLHINLRSKATTMNLLDTIATSEIIYEVNIVGQNKATV